MIWQPLIIGIQKSHHRLGPRPDAMVASRGDALIILREQSEPAIVKLPDHLTAAIGGTVIDHQDLRGRVDLGEDRLQGPANKGSFIVKWNDDRNYDEPPIFSCSSCLGGLCLL
jgi:hypothetical protein